MTVKADRGLDLWRRPRELFDHDLMCPIVTEVVVVEEPLLAAEGLPVALLHLGIPDRFIEHGSREDCLQSAGLDAASIGAAIERWWALQPQERLRSASGALS